MSEREKMYQMIALMSCNPRDWYVQQGPPRIEIWGRTTDGKRMIAEARDEVHTAFLCMAANNYQRLSDKVTKLESINSDKLLEQITQQRDLLIEHIVNQQHCNTCPAINTRKKRGYVDRDHCKDQMTIWAELAAQGLTR